MFSGITFFKTFENICKSYIPFPVKIPSLKLSWYVSEIALLYGSVPPFPAYILVNHVLLLISKSIPTLG